MDDTSLMPVDPVHPPAPYLGGKRVLAKTIIQMINTTPHTGYAEPFVGMGGVFLRRTMQPRVEAINDISGDVATSTRPIGGMSTTMGGKCSAGTNLRK